MFSTDTDTPSKELAESLLRTLIEQLELNNFTFDDLFGGIISLIQSHRLSTSLAHDNIQQPAAAVSHRPALRDDGIDAIAPSTLVIRNCGYDPDYANKEFRVLLKGQPGRNLHKWLWNIAKLPYFQKYDEIDAADMTTKLKYERESRVNLVIDKVVRLLFSNNVSFGESSSVSSSIVDGEEDPIINGDVSSAFIFLQ